MTISIEEMRSFAAVAAQGTFSAAARALGRSQSVVSTHIAGMENELGIRLFVRGTPAKLTPAGEELLPGALRVLREAERFESRASELFRLPEPLLYMGIDMALELPLLLDLLRDFSRQFPSARLQLENISSSESNWFFRRSHMTMAVIFSSRPDPECEEHLIGLAPRAVAVSKKHPLAAVERPSIEALQGVRQIVVNAHDSESESPITVSPDVWEVDGAQWAIGLAARGVGWTIVPRAVAMTQPLPRAPLGPLRPAARAPHPAHQEGRGPARLREVVGRRPQKDRTPPRTRSARINVTISARLCDGRSENERGIGTFPSFLQENARFGHVFDTMTLKTG